MYIKVAFCIGSDHLRSTAGPGCGHVRVSSATRLQSRSVFICLKYGWKNLFWPAVSLAAEGCYTSWIHQNLGNFLRCCSKMRECRELCFFFILINSLWASLRVKRWLHVWCDLYVPHLHPHYLWHTCQRNLFTCVSLGQPCAWSLNPNAQECEQRGSLLPAAEHGYVHFKNVFLYFFGKLMREMQTNVCFVSSNCCFSPQSFPYNKLSWTCWGVL